MTLKDLEKRINAIEEILKLDQKTWKEKGWACEDHTVFTSWCKSCIYNKIIGRN